MYQISLRPEEVQYMGMPGKSSPCLWAVDAIVNSEHPPRKASIVTWMKDRYDSQGEHLFLFWDWNLVPLTVVHSGFTSGYPGEGPRSFSMALCMIMDRLIPTNDIFLGQAEFYAIENRRLTPQLIELLRRADDKPAAWVEISPGHWQQVEDQAFWATHHEPKIVFDHIDPDISKQCRSIYLHDPGAAVAKAFIVVEERLRTLVGQSSEGEDPLIGERLITKALNPKNGILADESLTSSEREGLYLMFKGAYQFVRNPRAHRIVDENDTQLAVELLYHADLLLRLIPKRPPARSRTP